MAVCTVWHLALWREGFSYLDVRRFETWRPWSHWIKSNSVYVCVLAGKMGHDCEPGAFHSMLKGASDLECSLQLGEVTHRLAIPLFSIYKRILLRNFQYLITLQTIIIVNRMCGWPCIVIWCVVDRASWFDVWLTVHRDSVWIRKTN